MRLLSLFVFDETLVDDLLEVLKISSLSIVFKLNFRFDVDFGVASFLLAFFFLCVTNTGIFLDFFTSKSRLFDCFVPTLMFRTESFVFETLGSLRACSIFFGEGFIVIACLDQKLKIRFGKTVLARRFSYRFVCGHLVVAQIAYQFFDAAVHQYLSIHSKVEASAVISGSLVQQHRTPGFLAFLLNWRICFFFIFWLVFICGNDSTKLVFIYIQFRSFLAVEAAAA